MPIRQRLVTYGIPTVAAATLLTAALLSPWRAGTAPAPRPAPEPVAQQAPHHVDVVFAIDTTGSMGGLLDGAKRTVWSIATHIKQTDPNAEVRIGLVAYKDVGDAYTSYVTRDFALTTDLDGVFRELSSYTADGGGDTPEDVNKGLDDALHMQWRDDAKKLIFLVGDAPPADRHDAPTFDMSARDAANRGIIINTIRCGGDGETAATWSQIAMLGKGQYSSIAEDGGVKQIATPYDQKLAELSDRVDATTVIVGDEAAHRGYAENIGAAAAAPAAAKADRAMYYEAKGGGRAAGDLVTQYAEGKANLAAVPAADLPADLRDKSGEELKTELDRRVAVRKEAQAKMQEVVKARQEYLEHAAAGSASTGFDQKVNAAIDSQLK